LVNLLTRPELDDLILVEELNILKDNANVRESVSEILDKSQPSPLRNQGEGISKEGEVNQSKEK
jgi:hypothetical protein